MQSIKVLFEEDNPLRGIYKGILNEPAAFVPQLFSQFASLGDDTVRTSYVYGDDLQTSQNKIKARIPGIAPTARTGRRCSWPRCREQKQCIRCVF